MDNIQLKNVVMNKIIFFKYNNKIIFYKFRKKRLNRLTFYNQKILKVFIFKWFFNF